MNSDATIFIVDDDVAMCDSLALLLGLKGFRTQIFANAANLLSAYSPKWFGCMLVDVLQSAIDAHAAHRQTMPVAKRTQQLTTREQQVLDLVASGLHVKQIAEKLGIGPRTVEVYKSRMTHKLRVRNSDGYAGSAANS